LLLRTIVADDVLAVTFLLANTVSLVRGVVTLFVDTLFVIVVLVFVAAPVIPIRGKETITITINSNIAHSNRGFGTRFLE
jgi:hypothetical protein